MKKIKFLTHPISKFFIGNAIAFAIPISLILLIFFTVPHSGGSGDGLGFILALIIVPLFTPSFIYLIYSSYQLSKWIIINIHTTSKKTLYAIILALLILLKGFAATIIILGISMFMLFFGVKSFGHFIFGHFMMIFIIATIVIALYNIMQIKAGKKKN